VGSADLSVTGRLPRLAAASITPPTPARGIEGAFADLTGTVVSDSVKMIAGGQRTKHESFVCSIGGLPFSRRAAWRTWWRRCEGVGCARPEVAVVLPRYRGTKATAVVIAEPDDSNGRTRLRFPAIANGTQLNGVRYYFVDDPEYFDRDGLYGGSSGDYPDTRSGMRNSAALRSSGEACLAGGCDSLP